MAEKKRILFVMNTMGRAGAERALAELTRILGPDKYELFLYVLIPRGEVFAELPEYVTVLNKKTDRRSVLSPGGKLFVAKCLLKSAFRNGSAWKALKRLRAAGGSKGDAAPGAAREKILRRMLADGTPSLPGSYDLAVAYLEGPATWFVAEKVDAARKAAFLHVDYDRAGYTKALDQGCYEVFHRIFAVSKDVQEHFLNMYPEYASKTGLFFNIINRGRIEERSLLQGGFDDGYTGTRILTVGRLYYQKGYDIAVQAAKLLEVRGYEFRWYALGEGEEKKNIQKLIHKEGLEDRFVLLGAADNPYPYFRQADIYVCSSRFEGKSIVIEEAQVLGKPIVASACTGIVEQISSGTDGLVMEQGADALADGVAKLMDDPKLRQKYGEAARQKELPFEDGLKCFLELLEP